MKKIMAHMLFNMLDNINFNFNVDLDDWKGVIATGMICLTAVLVVYRDPKLADEEMVYEERW